MKKSRSFSSSLMLAVSILVLTLYLLGRSGEERHEPPHTVPPPGHSLTPPAPFAPALPTSDDTVVAHAFAERLSDRWVTLTGTVTRVLDDDTRGSKHQRFLVKLGNDMTLLVAHNIDLARRVPVSVGDSVRLHGEYEWNDKGGVIHWTHHNPRGSHEGGWIVHKTTTYR